MTKTVDPTDPIWRTPGLSRKSPARSTPVSPVREGQPLHWFVRDIDIGDPPLDTRSDCGHGPARYVAHCSPHWQGSQPQPRPDHVHWSVLQVCKSKLQYFLEFLHLVNVTRHSGYWPLLIFSKKKQPHYMLPLQRTRSRHDCNFIPGSPFLSAGNFLLVSPKLSPQPLWLFCLLSYPFSALLFLHDFNVVVDLKNLPRAKYTSKKLAKVWPNTNIGKVKTSHYFPALELVIFGGLQDVLEISTQIKVEIEITVQNVDHFSTFEMSNLVS